jgi:hypothetical protein
VHPRSLALLALTTLPELPQAGRIWSFPCRGEPCQCRSSSSIRRFQWSSCPSLTSTASYGAWRWPKRPCNVPPPLPWPPHRRQLSSNPLHPDLFYPELQRGPAKLTGPTDKHPAATTTSLSAAQLQPPPPRPLLPRAAARSSKTHRPNGQAPRRLLCRGMPQPPSLTAAQAISSSPRNLGERPPPRSYPAPSSLHARAHMAAGSLVPPPKLPQEACHRAAARSAMARWPCCVCAHPHVAMAWFNFCFCSKLIILRKILILGSMLPFTI